MCAAYAMVVDHRPEFGGLHFTVGSVLVLHIHREKAALKK